mgnify:CR=1 FL=1
MKWVVVADSVRCRLYQKEKAGSELSEKEAWVHPVGRQHDSDMMTDRAGSGQDAVGQGRHAMSPKTDPKEHEQLIFAHEICQKLEKARSRHSFQKLVLVAPPAFLGKLRAEMSGELRKLIVAEVNKDLTHCSADELEQYIRQAS